MSLNSMAQENQQSFSLKEIKGNGSQIEVNPSNYISYDNTKINYYRFTPKKPALAKLIFIHGGGAHSKLGYFKFAKELRDSFAIETILVDLRGHGMSEGKRGDSPDVSSIYKDINVLLYKEKSKNNLPVYLGGHSSGGGLIVNYNSWKKKEKVDGYIFVSPELGYKSDTEKGNRVPFAKVKVWKFVVNGITQGLMMQHSDVVFFNYPEKTLQQNPLILTEITVNMSKALTPDKPKKQFEQITEPIAMFVGDQDEMLDARKVIRYTNLPLIKNKKSVSKIIANQKHLSILNGIGTEIGNTILKWKG